MGATVSLPDHAILADQNNQREEDPLRGNDQSQDAERKRIKWLNDGKSSGVDQDPHRKPAKMQDNRAQAAYGFSENIADPFSDGTTLRRRLLELRYGFDILLSRIRICFIHGPVSYT